MPAGGGPGGVDELAIVRENEPGEGSAALAVRTTASRENAPVISFMFRFALRMNGLDAYYVVDLPPAAGARPLPNGTTTEMECSLDSAVPTRARLREDAGDLRTLQSRSCHQSLLIEEDRIDAFLQCVGRKGFREPLV